VPSDTAHTSLAERLGHGPDARLLIVNCDDLGSSHGANAAIARAMEAGIATSATLMVPCPWAREAARTFAGADVGVHLTLTSEYPGYRWRPLTLAPSLMDADGFLPATAALFAAQASVADARAECRAQIEQALAWGVDVTHIDSHMGTVQLEARFFDIYLEMAQAFALPVRMFGRRFNEMLGFGARERAAERRILFTDHLVDPWGKVTRDVFGTYIPGLARGVSEIFAHPVEDGPELRAYDLHQADVRAHDARVMTDPAIRAMIEESGVTPISYRPLRDAQRRGLAGA
jgi:chitin disaccharide deacetylase